ncbi:MAG: TonB-dependent receptor [Alphaproteobacteria bacterium]|nr:TonB-dependent receptor [Alphaproteobacteria bacterium]
MNPIASRLATLMGSASILTLSTAYGAHAQMTAQAQTAQVGPEAVPEQVLVTGSLIHGTAAVGVPVTNLGVQDFATTGYATIGELFQTIPAANVTLPQATINGGQQERLNRVNIRGLDTTGPRSLLMVDGIRYPPQADGLCVVDPSFIPALALDRIDVLADGASATYGSDAIAGVINVVLKRGYDGAITMLHFAQPTDGGGFTAQESQLWGRTWDGGDVTLTYEHDDLEPVKGNVHSKYTLNFTPWGLDNENPIGASVPATLSTGKPKVSNGNGVSGVGTVCSNCYAVPGGTGSNFNAALNNGLGPTAPGSAATFNWSSVTAGTTNELPNVLALGWEDAAQQKNALVGTFDQRLFPGVSLFFTGFYSNRRVENLEPPYYSNGVTNETKTLSVPTINPYYPTGAPAGLQVSTDLGVYVPTFNDAFEISARYSFGLNLNLPFGWTGQIYDSRSYETDQYYLHFVDSNYASNALGNVVNGNSKPASIPYLNVFCDPTRFQCNSPTTIKYIETSRHLGDIYQLEEKGARFDGPLFDLPGGQIKAAIGGDYESDNVLGIQANAGSVQPDGTPNSPTIAPLYDPEPYTVWAGFAQLDIPVFGDNFNIPFARRLDLEASWRHDQYSSPNGALAGGTSNPKLAFTWLIDDMVGATVRGSWGTSFRFANAGEYSVVLSDQNTGANIQGGATTATVQCVNGAAPAGSAGAVLVATGVWGCGSTPGGVLWGGGPHAALREYTDAATGQAATREGGLALAPETSENYSIGLELAPQIDFLRGFDFQATYYSVKINNVLTANNQLSSQNIADPLQRFTFIFPSDLGCPVADNANPTACAPFQKMVTATLLDAGSTVGISQASNVYFLRDGSTFGSGFQHVSGIDFNASYDLDLGDYGAWNTGITGTYYLHNFLQTVSGGTVIDELNQNVQPAGGILQNGVETTPRLIWRARLGWSDGPYSVTGFMNYSSHYFSPWAVPPNVNFQCTSSGGSTGGGTFPCAISNFSNFEPTFITFDLSLGYNTGDLPANDYLKRIALNLTIQNLTGIHSPFAYGPVAVNRNAAAYDIFRSDIGRVVGLTITKVW